MKRGSFLMKTHQCECKKSKELMKWAKRKNFNENAPMWVQKVLKKYRNMQSRPILMKWHQCERQCGHKKSKNISKMQKADDFQWKCTNVRTKSQTKLMKGEKRTNFNENAPMWMQKVRKLKKCAKCMNFDENALVWAQKVKKR